jgi:hypothetical protein
MLNQRDDVLNHVDAPPIVFPTAQVGIHESKQFEIYA